MRVYGFLTLAAAALSTASASAATNLVTDGTFDEGSSAGSFTTFPTGLALGAGSPWTVGTDANTGAASSVDLVGTYWAGPPGGGFSVDLDGTLGKNGSSTTDSVGSISEAVTIPTSGQYLLSFYVSGNQDSGSPTKNYSVSVDGFSAHLSTDNSAQLGQWTLVTQLVTLSAGATLLEFASLDTPANDQFGAVIGDVSLTAVPEQSTWAMMALGFAGLGFAGFRARRRQSASITD
jgi:hypothetical protein